MVENCWILGDLYRGEAGDEEPSWVENERDSFRTYRDKNGDGLLDHNEVNIQQLYLLLIIPRGTLFKL